MSEKGKLRNLIEYGKFTQNKIEHIQTLKRLKNAFQSDVEVFLKYYQTQNDITFEAFVKSWKESSLRTIFVKSTYTEFTKCGDQCFLIIKKFFMFSKTGAIQVGAIYLMYTLYRSEFFGKNGRIRLTADEHSTLEALAKRFLEEYLVVDVGYVFNYLKLKGVFKICTQHVPYGLEPKFMLQDKEVKNDIFGKKPTLETLGYNMFYSDKNFNLNRLQEIGDEYEQCYESILSGNPNGYTIYTRSDVVSEIKAELSAISALINESDSDEASSSFPIKKTRMTKKKKEELLQAKYEPSDSD